MTEEKEQTAISALLMHVWEMLPSDRDDREEQRDHLTNMYHAWLLEVGMDLETKELNKGTNLYYRFNEFLKLCKDIDPKDFHKIIMSLEKSTSLN